MSSSDTAGVDRDSPEPRGGAGGADTGPDAGAGGREATRRERRDPRSERTHAALRQAALRLMLERGFEATTVEDIAAAAQVTSRTFFRHFPTKEDVVLDEAEALIEEMRAALAAEPDDQPVLGAVTNALMSLADDFEKQRDHHLIRARIVSETPTVQARERQVLQQWEDLIADDVARRLGVDRAADPRPTLVAATTVTALRVARDRWLADNGRSHLPDLARELLGLLRANFGLPES